MVQITSLLFILVITVVLMTSRDLQVHCGLIRRVVIEHHPYHHNGSRSYEVAMEMQTRNDTSLRHDKVNVVKLHNQYTKSFYVNKTKVLNQKRKFLNMLMRKFYIPGNGLTKGYFNYTNLRLTHINSTNAVRRHRGRYPRSSRSGGGRARGGGGRARGGGGRQGGRGGHKKGGRNKGGKNKKKGGRNNSRRTMDRVKRRRSKKKKDGGRDDDDDYDDGGGGGGGDNSKFMIFSAIGLICLIW